MKLSFAVLSLGVSILSAQTPNLSGVWQANTEKSKGLPPQATYVVLIDQTPTALNEKVIMTGARGEQRSTLAYDLSGKETQGSYQGLPMKSTVTWADGTLTASAKQPGSTMQEKYTLSPDGKILTVESSTSARGRDTQRTLVLEKQPDSAADIFKKPEQTAKEHYKNIQILGDMPASQLINTMRYFTFALGGSCETCHVQGNFPSDDKPAKAMARKMITMTHGVNESTFGGKMEVRCFTCHQGHEEPQSTPSF